MEKDLFEFKSRESLANLNGENDITIKTMEQEKELLHFELTGAILNPGFLERVYKNALLIDLMK